MSETEDTFHLGVKALIQNQTKQVLLLKVNLEKLSGQREAYWDIPGGRVQRGSSVEDTLQREVEEEIGISEITNVRPLSMVLSRIRIPITPEDVGLILAVYTCDIDASQPITLSDEHTESKWFDIPDAAKLLEVKYPPEFTEAMRQLA